MMLAQAVVCKSPGWKIGSKHGSLLLQVGVVYQRLSIDGIFMKHESNESSNIPMMMMMMEWESSIIVVVEKKHCCCQLLLSSSLFDEE